MNWVTKNDPDNQPLDSYKEIFCLLPKRCVDGKTRWLEKIYMETTYWWGSFTQSWRTSYTYYPLTSKDILYRRHISFHDAIQQIKAHNL